MNPALLSSERTDWNTPPEVIKVVRKMGRIGLDPCSNAQSVVKAEVEYRLPEQNGLELPWKTDGLVFVNPPYGRGIEAWVSKCRQSEWQSALGVVALLPARPDTRWWQDNCAPPVSNAVCFLRGRLRFLEAPAPAPFPSALVYWGYRGKAFLEAVQGLGVVWR